LRLRLKVDKNTELKSSVRCDGREFQTDGRGYGKKADLLVTIIHGTC